MTNVSSTFRLHRLMIKVFFLIFEPAVAWDRIVQARRSFAFILLAYLLPMILLTSAVEGCGLQHWGKWQPRFQKFRDFSQSTGTVVTFEVIQSLLLLATVFVSALVVLKISQTFQNRSTYLQAFTTMAYGLSPLFLARLLDAGPMMSPWTSW